LNGILISQTLKLPYKDMSTILSSILSLSTNTTTTTTTNNNNNNNKTYFIKLRGISQGDPLDGFPELWRYRKK
jgi:hypothetical protein